MIDSKMDDLISIYGAIPPSPEHLDVKVDWIDCSFAAERARLLKYIFICHSGGKVYEFPAMCAVPSSEGPHPVIIHMDYELGLPSRYTPCEEILDMGYAVLQLSSADLFPEKRGDHTGLARLSRQRGARRSGRLSLYAYGIMRAIDKLSSMSEIDPDRICLVGHGELAEAVLLAAAVDQRVSGVMASGLCGISYLDSGLYGGGYLGGEDECARIERLSERISPKRVLLSFSDGDYTLGDPTSLRVYQGLSVHRRSGGSYLGRSEWQILCAELDKIGETAVPC